MKDGIKTWLGDLTMGKMVALVAVSLLFALIANAAFIYGVIRVSIEVFPRVSGYVWWMFAIMVFVCAADSLTRLLKLVPPIMKFIPSVKRVLAREKDARIIARHQGVERKPVPWWKLREN